MVIKLFEHESFKYIRVPAIFEGQGVFTFLAQKSIAYNYQAFSLGQYFTILQEGIVMPFQEVNRAFHLNPVLASNTEMVIVSI